jgi:hypothetical protein
VVIDDRPNRLTGILLGLGFVGTDQPFADQWAAEGMGFLRAPLHDKLMWASFFWPHGEHRPAVTRLLTYFYISNNRGQWDCFVEIVANLAIYAAYLAVAWHLACRVIHGRWILAVALFMALLFAQPAAYENFLWGFQSQFIFLLLTGLAQVTGTLSTARPGWIWWGAQLAGFAGLFSIAAGVMAPATLIIIAGLGVLKGRRDLWVWSTLLINAGLFAYGLWLLPPSITAGASHLSVLGEAVVRTGYLLAWPMAGFAWFPLCWAPGIGLVLSRCRRDAGAGKSGMVVAVGLWVYLMAFAVAYGRGITPGTIGVRYYDILVAGIFANGLSLVCLLRSSASSVLVFWRVVGAVWLGVMSVGLWAYNNPVNAGAMLQMSRGDAIEQTGILRRLIVSDDPTELDQFATRTRRFPHLQLTLELLRDKQVQPLLPPSLSVDGRVGPLSSLAPKIASGWWILLGAGVAALFAGAVCFFRQPIPRSTSAG